MNCDTVEELLLDYIEGQLDPAKTDAFRVHTDECPSCRYAVRETKELMDALHDAKCRQEKAWQMSQTADSLAPPPDESVAWTSGKRLGDFEIIEEIGRGGMGVVYRALQVPLNRIVALKVLPGMLVQSRSAVTRFKREAQAAAKLHHTNIVPVYAQGEYEGHFFYAMEVIDGEDLGTLLKTDPSRIVSGLSSVRGTDESQSVIESGITPVEPSLIRKRADYRHLARLVANVADGLDHAHKQNVLHRDIKPQNLLLGRDGELHITDFGLARLLDEPNVTVTGEMIGTPAYMSPEQIDADRDKIDHRTDIYSLGVTLYELMTGRRPFEASTREQIIARIRQREPKAPRRLDHHIPMDLETICLRAMEKNPARRYQSAGEMAADLRRYAEDKPILSRRVGPIEKTIKWIRRHPAMTAICALVLLVIVGGTIWTIQSIQERRERANNLVLAVVELLGKEDYREIQKAKAMLAEAEPLKPNPIDFIMARALSKLINTPMEAIKDLEVAEAQRPDDPRILYMKAWALRRSQHEKAFRDCLREADEAGGPNDWASHFFRGQAVVRKNPKEAADNFREADKLGGDQGFYQAKLHLGRAHNHTMYHNRKTEAFEELKRYLNAACTMRERAYPRYLLSIGYRIAGEIYAFSSDSHSAATNFEQAFKMAKEAQEIEPEFPQAYAAEAEYWEALGHYAHRAPRETGAQPRRDPPGAPNCIDMPIEDCRLERYQKALEAWDRGAPYFKGAAAVQVFEYRWRVHYWLGQFEQAERDLLAMANLLRPENEEHFLFARAYPALLLAERGRQQEATNAVEAILRESRGKVAFGKAVTTGFMLHLLEEGELANDVLTDIHDRIDFDATGTGKEPQGWHQAVYEFCLDPGHIEILERLEKTWHDSRAGDEKANELEDEKIIWSLPHLFAAGRALGIGDRETAIDRFKACAATYDYDEYCYIANIFLYRMALDPGWPKWVSP